MIIVVDMRRSFTADLGVAFAMSNECPFELKELNSMEDVDSLLSVPGKIVEKIVVAQNILKNSSMDKKYLMPVQCYLESDAGWSLAEKYNLPCYGVVTDADELFEMLEKDPSVKRPPKQGAKNTHTDKKEDTQENHVTNLERPAEDDIEDDGEMDVFESDYDDYELDNVIGSYDEESESDIEDMDFGEEEPFEDMLYKNEPEEEAEEEAPEAKAMDPTPVPKKDLAKKKEAKEPPASRKIDKEKRPEKSASKKISVYDDPEKEKELMEDMGKKKPATKIITVYSAKGGVGKTTIATELATYLALVTRGRHRLRVCIVDYNIDFGDVSTTLAIPQKGVNLAYWADEIREFLAEGKQAEDIEYTRSEIEEWLRKDENTGLYLLVAPVTNEDSSEINGEEMDIILDNLKRNGEFDFIICDTGNNTRNSTMTAIEFADMVLMVVDQNINTASCDERFLNTMKVLDFDLSKTRMVVNRVMPSRMTTIPIQELLDCFPYDCIGKLKFSTDVIKATNLGKPLALNDPDNEYVKQMSEIVAYILDDESFLEERPKKRSILSKIFGKK